MTDTVREYYLIEATAGARQRNAAHNSLRNIPPVPPPTPIGKPARILDPEPRSKPLLTQLIENPVKWGIIGFTIGFVFWKSVSVVGQVNSETSTDPNKPSAIELALRDNVVKSLNASVSNTPASAKNSTFNTSSVSSRTKRCVALELHRSVMQVKQTPCAGEPTDLVWVDDEKLFTANTAN